MRKRLGDTLVEVALAIGIFSMVAITVVAVVSGSSSGAQSALETTVTREQIDAQAEALRFIHNSYIADVKSDTKDNSGNVSSNRKYTSLWRAMTSSAKDESELGEDGLRAFLNPTTCKEVYNNKSDALVNNHAFVINTRKLGIISDKFTSTDIGETIVKDKMSAPVTYPRLVYGNSTDTSSLADASFNAINVSSAEGLYIIPVRDADSTTIITTDTIEHGAAYYDFYIMSCWYSGNSERPSTISTVVRLYDPDVITETSIVKEYELIFDPGKNPKGDEKINIERTFDVVKMLPGGEGNVPTSVKNHYSLVGYSFVGWSTTKGIRATDFLKQNPVEAKGQTIDCKRDEKINILVTSDNQTIKCRAPSTSPTNRTNQIAFYAVWQPKPYDLTLQYHSNNDKNLTEIKGPQSEYGDSDIDLSGGKWGFIPPSNWTDSDHRFLGWTDQNGKWYNYKSGKIAETLTTPMSDDPVTIDLYAQWAHRIVYNTNSSWTVSPHECSIIDGCYLASDEPTKSGFRFGGWCTEPLSDGAVCGGTTYQAGEGFPVSELLALDTPLYAIWNERNEEITILAEWTSNTDYDSHMRLSDPNGNGYRSATYSTTNINVTYHGQTYSLVTGAGDGIPASNGRHYEKFTINTLGGKNYYYSIRKFNSGNVGDDITITVSGQNMGTKKFYSKDMNCQGNYWNVFAYKDGTIEERNTCSSSIEYDY